MTTNQSTSLLLSAIGSKLDQRNQGMGLDLGCEELLTIDLSFLCFWAMVL